jgi:hypothetical protein
MLLSSQLLFALTVALNGLNPTKIRRIDVIPANVEN